MLFVFSVVNPWGATAWELLRLVNQKWLKNVIFVLQQADLRNPEEVEVIKDHLRVALRSRRWESRRPLLAVLGKEGRFSLPDDRG